MTANAPRPSTVIMTALAGMLLLQSFGIFLNDEAAQLDYAHAIVHGHLTPVDQQEHFYAIGEGVMLNLWAPGTNLDSTYVAMAHAPAYFTFKVLDPVLHPTSVLLLVFVGCCYVLARRTLDVASIRTRGEPFLWWYQRLQLPREGKPFRMPSTTLGHTLLIVLLAAAWFIGWGGQTDMDFDLWGAFYSVQSTAILQTAVATWLFHRLIHRHTGSLYMAAIGAMVFLAGPMMFWGTGIKYHGPAIFLFLAALTLWDMGGRARWGALGVAAVSFWNAPLGAALFGTSVLLVLIAFLRDLRAAGKLPWRSVGLAAGAFAGAAGIIATISHATYGHPYGNEQIAALMQNGDILGSIAGTLRFTSWQDSFQNLLRVLFDGRGIQEGPLAMVPMAPVLLFGAVALQRWNRVGGDAAVFAVTHSLIFFVLFTHAAHSQGAGQDVRFFSHALPGMMFIAILGLYDVVKGIPIDEMWASAAGWISVFAMAMVGLWVLADKGVELVEGEWIRQIINMGWYVGTVTWIALGTWWLAKPAAVRTWGLPAWNRSMATLLGIAMVPATLWTVQMFILINRTLPPWPFGIGAEGSDYLFPPFDELRQWLLPRMIPAT